MIGAYFLYEFDKGKGGACQDINSVGQITIDLKRFQLLGVTDNVTESKKSVYLVGVGSCSEGKPTIITTSWASTNIS
jgi:hypothetical protein